MRSMLSCRSAVNGPLDEKMPSISVPGRIRAAPDSPKGSLYFATLKEQTVVHRPVGTPRMTRMIEGATSAA